MTTRLEAHARHFQKNQQQNVYNIDRRIFPTRFGVRNCSKFWPLASKYAKINFILDAEGIHQKRISIKIFSDFGIYFIFN